MDQKPKRKRGRPRKHPLPAPVINLPAPEVQKPDPVTAGLKSLQSSLLNILPADPLPGDPAAAPAGAAPAPAAPGDPAADSGIHSPASGTVTDNFERVAAALPPTIGDQPDAATTGGVPAAPGGGPGAPAPPATFNVAFSEETVAHWLPVPFKILARIFDDDACELDEWEKEIWLPAVQGVLNRYLPEFLRMTDRPELAMLGLAAATYFGMRTKIFFRRKKPAAAPAPAPVPVSMPGASTMAASTESRGSLDNLGPAKVI